MRLSASVSSVNFRPMRRLAEKIVFFGLVTAWRLAAWPTRRSPFLAKATTDGVVRAPSEFSRTVGSPPSMTAIQELVVPRSIPRILDMLWVPFFAGRAVDVAPLFAHDVPWLGIQLFIPYNERDVADY